MGYKQYENDTIREMKQYKPKRKITKKINFVHQQAAQRPNCRMKYTPCSFVLLYSTISGATSCFFKSRPV